MSQQPSGAMLRRSQPLWDVRCLRGIPWLRSERWMWRLPRPGKLRFSWQFLSSCLEISTAYWNLESHIKQVCLYSWLKRQEDLRTWWILLCCEAPQSLQHLWRVFIVNCHCGLENTNIFTTLWCWPSWYEFLISIVGITLVSELKWSNLVMGQLKAKLFVSTETSYKDILQVDQGSSANIEKLSLLNREQEL